MELHDLSPTCTWLVVVVGVGAEVAGGAVTVTVAVVEGALVTVAVVDVGTAVDVGAGSVSPGLLPHPVPPLGTKLTAGSFPLYSDFRLGKLAGGLRAEGIFPKLCMPWRRDDVLLCWWVSNDSPLLCLYKLFMSSD